MSGQAALANGQAVITAASGGEALPADTAGGAWTTLTGPMITETKARDVGGPGLGTIVLTAPSGFEFNPNAPVAVLLDADGHKTINQLPDGSLIPIDVTPATITLTITATSRGGAAWPDTLLFQNIQVRPTAGFPLTSGHITQSGTCIFRELKLATGTWGFLRTVGGVLAGYQLSGDSSGTAGTPVTIGIQRVDQFGNPLPGSTIETLIFSGPGTIGTYTPTIDDSSEAFAGGIPVIFDSNGSATVTLVAYKAETATLEVTGGTASSSGVAGGLDLMIAPGPASSLVFVNPPLEVTYGSPFDLVVQTIDQYGNLSAIGLDPSVPVTLSLAGSTSTLIGTLTQDAGAGNGTANFTDLQIDNAGTQTVIASANGLTAGTTVVKVNPAIVTPIVSVAGKVYDGTTAADITSRKLSPVVGMDEVTLGDSGTAVFSDRQAGAAKPVLVTGLRLSGKAAANYRLSATFVAAVADILRAPATLTLASSENPSLHGSRVTFTASLAPPTPAAGIPTGTVLFLANGQPLAAAVLLSAGMASAGTETLPLWDSVITAAYLGDSNFLGSTNALGQLVRPQLELPRVVSIVDNVNGTVTVTCHGTPAVEHYIEATATVDVPLSWVCVSTNTAGMWDGFWTYTEEKGQNTQRFFRAVKPY